MFAKDHNSDNELRSISPSDGKQAPKVCAEASNVLGNTLVSLYLERKSWNSVLTTGVFEDWTTLTPGVCVYGKTMLCCLGNMTFCIKVVSYSLEKFVATCSKQTVLEWYMYGSKTYRPSTSVRCTQLSLSVLRTVISELCEILWVVSYDRLGLCLQQSREKYHHQRCSKI